jgi:anti-anti-sigma factor
MARSYRPPHPRTTGPQLSCQVSYRLGHPLIYVEGELDHDTANTLRGAIEQEMVEGPTILLLEFSELKYMDSAGLTLMFDTLRRFKEPGWLGVVAPNSGVRRLMEITGLVDHSRLRILTDPREAAAAVNNPDEA